MECIEHILINIRIGLMHWSSFGLFVSSLLTTFFSNQGSVFFLTGCCSHDHKNEAAASASIWLQKQSLIKF